MTAPLLISLLVSLPFLFVLARRPILRRLALRNAIRRPREALLVVLGSLLGAAIITGSAVVGDTMDASIRQMARQHLGPIDELVLASNAGEWRSLSNRLRALPASKVDGVLTLATIGRGDDSRWWLDAADRAERERDRRRLRGGSRLRRCPNLDRDRRRHAGERSRRHHE